MSRTCDRCCKSIPKDQGFSIERASGPFLRFDGCEACVSEFANSAKYTGQSQKCGTAVVEPVCRFSFYGLLVRCWLKDGQTPPDHKTFWQSGNWSRTPRELAEELALRFNMNACEVTDNNGQGVVFYPEWP